MNRAGYLLLSLAIPAVVLLGFFHLCGIPAVRCPFASFLHIHCPMCGTTRAFQALFAGQVGRAFRYNPFFLLWAAFCLLAYLDVAVRVFRPQAAPGRACFVALFESRAARIGFMGLFLLMVVYNNFFNRL